MKLIFAVLVTCSTLLLESFAGSPSYSSRCDYYKAIIPFSTLRRAASSYHGLYRFLNVDIRNFANWDVQLGQYLLDYTKRPSSAQMYMHTLNVFVSGYIYEWMYSERYVDDWQCIREIMDLMKSGQLHLPTSFPPDTSESWS